MLLPQAARGSTRIHTLALPNVFQNRENVQNANVQNSAQENVGQIKDVVIDPASTRVQYVAVTYGGFLGLGGKLFAVPMQAIKVTQDPNNRDRVVLVLDVTKEQMNGAKGFDKANWPNFSDANFAIELHHRYKTEDLWNRSSSNANQADKNRVNITVDGIKK